MLLLRCNTPTYLHLTWLPQLYTNLEVLKCQPTCYPPLQLINQQCNTPVYLHLIQIPQLYTNLEILKCQPTHYPPPQPINQQLYSSNLSQHVQGKDGSIGIWAAYPCACVVTVPDQMTLGQFDAKEPDARLYGWVLLLSIFSEYWQMMLYTVPPSMHWVQGCSTKVMNMWGLCVDKEDLAAIEPWIELVLLQLKPMFFKKWW